MKVSSIQIIIGIIGNIVFIGLLIYSIFFNKSSKEEVEKAFYRIGTNNILNCNVNELTNFDIKSDGDYILTYNLQVELILNIIHALTVLKPTETLSPSEIHIYSRVKLNGKNIGPVNQTTISTAMREFGQFSLGWAGTYGYAEGFTKSDGTLIDDYSKYDFITKYATKNDGVNKYYKGGNLSRSLNNRILLKDVKKSDKVSIVFSAGNNLSRFGNDNKDEQDFLLNNLFRGSVEYTINLNTVSFEDL